MGSISTEVLMMIQLENGALPPPFSTPITHCSGDGFSNNLKAGNRTHKQQQQFSYVQLTVLAFLYACKAREAKEYTPLPHAMDGQAPAKRLYLVCDRLIFGITDWWSDFAIMALSQESRRLEWFEHPHVPKRDLELYC